MNKGIFTKLTLSFILFLSLAAFKVQGQTTPTIKTDLDDYPPGSTAIITGSGFQPNEIVTLQVLHADGDELGTDEQYHQPWEVSADENGNVSSTWWVPDDGDALGATLKLTANGNMGSYAEWIFTDGTLSSVTVVPLGATSVNYGTGGLLQYRIDVVVGGNTQSTSVPLTLSLFGLPAGTIPANISVSGLPATLTFPQGSNTPNQPLSVVVTLLIQQNAKVPATPGFTVIPTGSPNKSASGVLTINPLSITGSITANNKVYNGDNAATIATRSLTGVINGDNVTYTGGSATFSDKNAADGKTVTATGLSLTGPDFRNYSVNTTATTTANIFKKDITGNIIPASKQYDGNATATFSFPTKQAGGDLTGIISGDDVTLANGTAAFSDKNVANGKTVTANLTDFTLAGTTAGNYNLTAVNPKNTANITPKSLTAFITVEPTKVYNGATASVVLTQGFNGVIAPDVVTCTGAFASYADANVGTGKTVTGGGLTLGGADAGNYSFTGPNPTTTANITAKPLTATIAATPSKVYDGNASVVLLTQTTQQTFSGAVEVVDLQQANQLRFNIGSVSYDNKNVGTGKTVTAIGLTITGSSAGNYSLTSTSASTTANITQRPLTVAFTGGNKVYDGTTAATPTPSLTTQNGFVSGDALTVSVSYGSANFVDKNIGTKNINIAGISLSGTDAGNYLLQNTTATRSAVISQRPLAVTAVTDTKVYDATTASSASPTVPALQTNDVVNVAPIQVYDNPSVGNNHVLTVTPAGLTIKDNLGANTTPNYNISYVASPATGVILQASTTTALVSSVNPSVFGQSTTFTATVSITAPGAGTVSGTVDFYDGVTQIGTGTISGAQASFSTAALSVATHSITAVYSGDVSFTGSTSAVLSQVVNKAATTTSVVSSVNPSVLSQSVTFTATVSVTSPGAGAVTGTVDFKDGATVIGTGTISGTQATFSTGALSVATHNITAVYSGDGSFNGSTSSVLSQVVNKRSSALLYSGGATIQYSDVVTLSATLSDNTGVLPAISLAGKTISFTIGTQSTTATTDATGFATTTLTITQAPGNYTVATSFAGDASFLNSSDSDPFSITKEDACVFYNGDLFLNTNSSTGGTALVNLKVTLTDKDDSYRGDIRNAIVKFNVMDGANIVAGSPFTATISSVSADNTSAVFAVSFTASGFSSTLLSKSYDISWTINGYYQSDATCSENSTVVTVSVPTSDFVTGGGYVKLTNPYGKYAGDVGSKNNFGFSVKWNKSFTNIQGGGINALIRKGNTTLYQVKSVKVTALTVTPKTATAPAMAAFTSNAVVNTIVNGVLVSSEGNCTATVEISDVCEPGSGVQTPPDEIVITVRDKNGLIIYASKVDASNKPVKQLLTGGNLQIHNGSITGAPTCTVTASRALNQAIIVTPAQAEELTVKVMPNPTPNHFNMAITGKNNGLVTVRVLDIYGRLVQLDQKIAANSTLRLGEKWTGGTYLIEVRQGDEKKVVKVIKAN